MTTRTASSLVAPSYCVGDEVRGQVNIDAHIGAEDGSYDGEVTVTAHVQMYEGTECRLRWRAGGSRAGACWSVVRAECARLDALLDEARVAASPPLQGCEMVRIAACECGLRWRAGGAEPGPVGRPCG